MEGEGYLSRREQIGGKKRQREANKSKKEGKAAPKRRHPLRVEAEGGVGAGAGVARF